VSPSWDIAEESGPLAWVCNNASKPGRAPAETWVVHADAEWSNSHLEADPPEVVSVLSRALAELLGTGPPRFSIAHRWRYARVERPVGEPCAYVPSAGVGICGDWMLGPRVECAYDSGVALARQIASVARTAERFVEPES
jgi:predicted NAD/FAD-dependent oxidoreductase